MARRSKAEMAALRRGIYGLARDNRPCTVRQIYYLGIGVLWGKDVGGSRKAYKDVVRLTGDLREAGVLPWGWIADNTRWVRQVAQYDDLDDALAAWAQAYRRDLWRTQPNRVEVWCESDSISGVIGGVTARMGVPLFVCRGQASKTFVYEAVDSYRKLAKPVTILYVGDWDPTGLAIPRALEDRIARYGADLVDEVELERVAVSVEDREEDGLISHGVNLSDPTYRTFADECERLGLDPQTAVEVEAVPPHQLRDRLEDAIDLQIEDEHAWEVASIAEESEREVLGNLNAEYLGLDPEAQ